MKNEYQKVEQAVGRPLLQWTGKKPIESVQFYPAQEVEVYGDKSSKDFNKLFWGDNLQVLSHLLKEYRGKVDLIYIDPPFDSKADYVKKVKLRGEEIMGVQQGLLEEKQYTDIWEKDEYLQFMYERLLLMKELLSEKGSIFLHCDWHKSAYLRLIMDEVFGEQNYVNEIIRAKSNPKNYTDSGFGNIHDTIYLYAKTKTMMQFSSLVDRKKEDEATTFPLVEEGTGRRYKTAPLHADGLRNGPSGGKWKGMNPPAGKHWAYTPSKLDELDAVGGIEWSSNGNPRRKVYADENEQKKQQDIWMDYKDVGQNDYPTQKPEGLLELIIKSASSEGDVVADFFMGSGTTQTVAQRLGRKWIGCDINKGAIQTTTKRLNQVIVSQQDEMSGKLLKDFKGSLGFKVLNVNDYDVFKNEVLAKEIVMEMYGVEPIKRSYFDGVLGKDFVKVMPMNRVLNKMDIRSILKSVQDGIGSFTVKTSSKAKDAVYDEKVRVICSGVEYDVPNFLKKENKTGVVIEINDVLESTKELIFKEYPESKIDVKAKDQKLTLEIKEFYSPLLMRKLEIENEKVLNKKEKAKVEDFKQIIDSVAIDVDYNGKLFNAEIIDLPEKKEVVKAKYTWEYPKKGKYTVAIKVVDVLGEEYFETFEVTA